MTTPKLKIFLLFIIFFLLNTTILCFFIFQAYDQNSFLNIAELQLEKIIYKLFKNKRFEKKSKLLLPNKSYNIINFNKKISSDQLLYLLYYLNNSEIDYLVINTDFNKIMDYYNNEKIKNMIKDTPNYFSSIYLSGIKSIKLLNIDYSKIPELNKNLIFLRNNNQHFIFSSFIYDPKIENTFSIPGNKIGFINIKKNILNKNNQDILIKFNNKYLVSLPFLLYCYSKNIDLDKAKYNYFFMNFSGENTSHPVKFYYDQKGKATIKHSTIKTAVPEVNQYENWENSIKIRMSLIDKLNTLGITNTAIEDKDVFRTNDEIINEIYDYNEYKDETKNETLRQVKDDASIWNGFKKSNLDKLSGSAVFITTDNNTAWVKDLISSYNILMNGYTYVRLPLTGIILISILLSTILIFANYILNKTRPINILFAVLLNILNPLLYFGLRIFLSIDFPFLVIPFLTITSLFFGILTRYIKNYSWTKAVKSIFKNSMSDEYAAKTSELWKTNKWTPESSSYICTFMHIDTSSYLLTDLNENDIELISSKNTEIENIIKNNFGVRNSFSTSEILSYFGNPYVNKNHAELAIKTAKQVNKKFSSDPNNLEKYKIAIHTRKEWFKFINKKSQKYYTYYGKSVKILSAMIKYAKEFNVDIIISDAAYKIRSFKKNVRMLDRIKIKNIDGTIRLMELLPDNTDNKFYDFFHAGLKLFEKRLWEEAGVYFKQCIKLNENDIPSQMFLRRCKDYIYLPPEEDWDGCFEIT